MYGSYFGFKVEGKLCGEIFPSQGIHILPYLWACWTTFFLAQLLLMIIAATPGGPGSYSISRFQTPEPESPENPSE